MTQYEPIIGLEVHAQLLTQSKMFCACSTEFGKRPNTQTCPICLGLPGSLPVLNRKAVEMAVRTGLALNCQIPSRNRFARKHYFYPDLPKGYQISQYEAPICEHGAVQIGQNGHSKRIRIRRAHLEEDAGKNVHDSDLSTNRQTSCVDLNRAGTPLLEIVTEPDMGSSDEVVAYLRFLRDILVYLGVCDGNMEQGSLRCEPNISLRPVGTQSLGTKVELKNINSFRFVKDAIDYEIKRQTAVLSEGGPITQETRLWDADNGRTATMRSKEEAHDYRYFPDPDLVPVVVAEAFIDEIRRTLPELPAARHARFVMQYGLPDYDAGVLTTSRQLADYFETCVKEFPHAKTVSNWVMGELLRELNNSSTPVEQSPVSPARLVSLLKLVENGTISLKVAREMFPELYASATSPEQIVKEKSLAQVSDEGALEKLVEEAVAKHPQQVTQYRSGKEAVFGFFVGQVMKASGGKANPAKVNELLKRKLAG